VIALVVLHIILFIGNLCIPIDTLMQGFTGSLLFLL